MIILKKTANTQTFYINKNCSSMTDPVYPFYTKNQSDNRYQLKGDYVLKDEVETLIDKQIDPINSEINELEVSKQEVFQVNYPMSFSREGEDLQLSIDLSTYATKIDLNPLATKEEVNNLSQEVKSKADKATTYTVSEVDNKFVQLESYNAKITELEATISAIQAQIGNISSTLDNINGEVI